MTEAQRAKAWRESHNLSFDQLAELTGYSPEAIRWFEKGLTPRKEAVRPWVWQRYKRVCQGVHYLLTLKHEFDWGN